MDNHTTSMIPYDHMRSHGFPKAASASQWTASAHQWTHANTPSHRTITTTTLTSSSISEKPPSFKRHSPLSQSCIVIQTSSRVKSKARKRKK